MEELYKRCIKMSGQ
jgi:hypothetical protein